MFDFHKCFPLDSPPKTYRKVISLAYFFLHRSDAQSIPTGSFLREHCCVSPAVLRQHAGVSALCSAAVLDELLADVILDQSG